METDNQIQTLLRSGTDIGLAVLERKVNFEMIFLSKEKPFVNLPEDQEGDMMESIIKLAGRFLKVNFPDTAAKEVAQQFAIDTLSMWPFWKLMDVLHFFRFVRQRQDIEEMKVYGSSFKMTPTILMRLATIYEMERSYALDAFQMKQRFPALPENEQKMIERPEVKTMVRDLGRKLAKQEDDRKSKVLYKNAESTNQWHRDMEKCTNWLLNNGWMDDNPYAIPATMEEKKAWYRMFYRYKIGVK